MDSCDILKPEHITGLKVFLKEKERKSFSKIFREFFELYRHKKEIPYYYFKYLYFKDVHNIHDYISTKEVAKIHRDPSLHRPELTTIINNKLAFSLFASEHSLKVPKLYGYHFGPTYYLKKNSEQIKNTQDVYRFLKRLFNTVNAESVFVKPQANFGGKGCFVLRNDNSLLERIHENQKELLSGKNLFYELVSQHPKINEIHSNCLNTIRIVSYITPEGKIEFLPAFMRFGVDESPVDNGSSGGIFVGIDRKNGALQETGRKKIAFGGEEYSQHPNSNYKFDGFKIPFLEESYSLVSSFLKYLPDRFIGWDIGISQNGPIIIEANDTPNLDQCNFLNSGLLQNKEIKNLVDQYNSKN